MNDFSRCNKISGTYWLKKDLNGLLIKNGMVSKRLSKYIELGNNEKLLAAQMQKVVLLDNVRIVRQVSLAIAFNAPANSFYLAGAYPTAYWNSVIKLMPQNGIISLPKFEDYSNRSNILNLDNITKEYSFKWQDKHFSQWEVQQYSDHHNCISELELNYYEVIKNTDSKSCKIFTYIHEDYYMPLPLEDMKKRCGVLNFVSYFALLNLNDPLRKIFGRENGTLSTTHLFNKSHGNVNTEEENWKAMHIVFDNSDYNEDLQLVYKQEVPLVSLYHNLSQNYLIVTPDVNNLDLNPYTVESPSGVQCGYHYAVEVEFNNVIGGDELVNLLKKLYKKWEKTQKNLLSFHMPPIGTRQYYITLEILTAREFEMDNLYIKFDFKVPEELGCKDTLHGRTHTSAALTTKDGEVWNFGHIIEFTVEAAKTDPAPVKLFFEVISTDWWGRHRTEGYTYIPLPLHPGCYNKQLRCRRPEELNTVEANSRRFFVGGCHLIKDLDVLLEPQLKDSNFTFTTTGSIFIRWQIISQWQAGTVRNKTVSEPTCSISTASALLRGAEAALHKYRRAKARLAAATEHLTEVQDSENTPSQGKS